MACHGKTKSWPERITWKVDCGVIWFSQNWMMVVDEDPPLEKDNWDVAGISPTRDLLTVIDEDHLFPIDD